MSRSSARRAQVSPLAALVALLAVCAGVSLYAGTLDTSLHSLTGPDPTVRTVADRTLDTLAPTGVTTPARLANRSLTAGAGAVPEGYRVNVTLVAGGERWQRGPAAPPGAGRTVRALGVRLDPGRVVPGRLRVVVWS
ncbi:DUF7285 family protein [Halomarina litorea]|uniref:DUF7285 family protein n=1 Tax=Halomarina litorea TaxID=2961595 RepID=UPI0020C1F24D|nr:hypothetical protein [Halomarina sp. BCD28]